MHLLRTVLAAVKSAVAREMFADLAQRADAGTSVAASSDSPEALSARLDDLEARVERRRLRILDAEARAGSAREPKS